MSMRVLLGLAMFAYVGLTATERFRADFSRTLQPQVSVASSEIIWHGSPVIAEDMGMVSGEGALFLPKGSYGEIPRENLDVSQGMITFWYKPLGETRQSSRTLFSAGWDWKTSYLVYSHGWWEHTGNAGTSYFIFNNEGQLGGIPEGRKDKDGVWDFYALGWGRQRNGILRLRSYRGGWLIGENVSKTLPPAGKLVTNLFLGTDLGCGTLSKGRSAQGYFRNLTIHDRCLSQGEVTVLMSRELGSAARAMKLREQWRQDVVGRAPRESRDKAGRLLESRMVSLEGNPFQRSRQDIVRLVERIRQSGFNAVMPNVWYGSAEYMTERFPESQRVKRYRQAFPGENGYEIFIEEAHRRGIEVHASFGIGFGRWNDQTWTCYQIPSHAYMNYYDPAFRKIMVEAIVDHAATYPVDGINLDYVRTEGGLETEVAAQEYFRLYKRQLSHDCKDQERMKAFTARCVGEVVYQAQKQLRRQHPKIIVSAAAGKQVREDGLRYNGRNSVFWLEAGWVDFILCMDYDTMLNLDNMDRCRAATSCPQGFVEGLANFKYYFDYDGRRVQGAVPEELWLSKLDYVRRKYNDGNGIFVYFWNVINDQNIVSLRKGPFKELALPSWQRQRERKTLNQVFPCPLDDEN